MITLLIVGVCSLIVSKYAVAQSQCEDIQKYRESNLQKSSDFNKSDPIRSCLNRKANEAFQMNKDDLAVIDSFLRDVPEIKSADELCKVFGKDSLYAKNKEAVEKDIPKFSEHKMEHWLARFSLGGPIGEFVKATTETRDGLGNCTENSNTAFGELIRLQKKSPHLSLTQILKNVASKPDFILSTDNERKKLSPFIAKNMLFEYLRAKSRNPGHFQQLLKNLKLKYSYENPDPRKLIAKDKLHTVTLNNGYVLGAHQEWIESFGKKDGGTQGVDCTTLIQSCAEEVYGKPWLVKASDPNKSTPDRMRLNSIYPFMMIDGKSDKVPAGVRDFYLRHFQIRKVTSERELKPGDFVFTREHMFLFAGYKKDTSTGKVEALTFEASGNEKRAVSVFYRQFYNDPDCAKLAIGETNGDEVYVLDTKDLDKVSAPESATTTN